MRIIISKLLASGKSKSQKVQRVDNKKTPFRHISTDTQIFILTLNSRFILWNFFVTSIIEQE